MGQSMSFCKCWQEAQFPQVLSRSDQWYLRYCVTEERMNERMKTRTKTIHKHRADRSAKEQWNLGGYFLQQPITTHIQNPTKLVSKKQSCPPASLAVSNNHSFLTRVPIISNPTLGYFVNMGTEPCINLIRIGVLQHM